MGFETKAIVASKLPSDVPDATAVSADHPDGAVFRSEVTGERFRLRHARWVPIVQRQRKPSNGKASK